MRISARIKRLASNVWRLVIVFLLFAFCFSLFAGFANAQTSTSKAVGNQQALTGQYGPSLNQDVPKDQHSYVQSAMIETISAMICQLTGFDPVKPNQKCLGIDRQTGKIGFVENGGGAIGAMGQLIALTFTPAVSSGDYVRYLSGNFGFPKKAYAQSISACANAQNGVGFCGIRPLLDVWVGMRNIAYLLFVLIFVLVGIAIMLRVHIDPRTVMTIENQIPRIIVGILLVTFSFAIAGLLIDIMYVSIYLVGAVLVQAYPTPFVGAATLDSVATSPTPFDIINRLFSFVTLSTQAQSTMTALITGVLSGGYNTEPGFLQFISDLFNSIVGLIIGILALFFVALGLIYASIRLWIILILAYINILLDVVFAPFWFLIGLLPGSSLGVGAWFKDMLANLAVFPTAIAMFILAKIFSTLAGPGIGRDTGLLFTPPLVGGGANGGSDVFAGIVALGFIFMTPHVLNITRNAIKAPQINYGPVFQPIGAAGGTIRGTAQMGVAATTPITAQGRGAVLRRIVGL